MKKFNHLILTLLVFGAFVSPSFISADNKDVALVLKTKGTVGKKSLAQPKWRQVGQVSGF